ncbi:hypothetical protein BWI17_03650 [Betaproteobacteria bacterium GR16-43]|nr:hypothetical protein BWI17_03650 [Betaproteobacteria bacterium GR16-43]
MKTLEKFKERVRRLKLETHALYLAARDPRTPWYAKWLVGGVVAYAISPIDLIPDFIPVLGYLDDLVLVPLGIAVAVKLVPQEVLVECRARAQEIAANGKPVSRIAAAVIIGIWGLLAALCFFIGSALADAPLPPPAAHRVVSPNGKFAAISDPGTGTQGVELATGKPLWKIPGWFRSLYISDDGEHLAVGYGGLNLLALDADDSVEMIGFWNHGRKVKSVPLRAIVPDRSILRRTVSHYAWGSIGGIDAGNRLVVTRVDGRVFRFNMDNGEAE